MLQVGSVLALDETKKKIHITKTCYIELWMRVRGMRMGQAVVIVEVKSCGLSDDEFCEAYALHVHQALQANPIDDGELCQRLHHWHPSRHFIDICTVRDSNVE